MAQQPHTFSDSIRLEDDNGNGFEWSLFNANPSIVGLDKPEGQMVFNYTDKTYHQKIGPGDFDWTEGSALGTRSYFFKAVQNGNGKANTSGTYHSYLAFTPVLPYTKDYKVDYALSWSFNHNASDMLIRFVVDGVTQKNYQIEPWDAGGIGILLEDLSDPPTTVDTGTNQRWPLNGSFLLTNQPAGATEIKIEFALGEPSTGRVGAMYFGYLSIEEL